MCDSIDKSGRRTSTRRAAARLLWHVTTLLPLLVFAGCGKSPDWTTIEAAPSSVRAARRAYDGAPPVIPHVAQGAACTTCHTATGRPVPGLVYAPPNPHTGTPEEDRTQNCRQCHVFSTTSTVFVESDFEPMPQSLVAGQRLYAGAPPVIPHRVFMHENCAACHDGPAARAEIRCTHPERVRCTQCHLQRTISDDAAVNSQASPPPKATEF